MCFKIMKYIRRNLPNTEKCKYTWVVYHSSGVVVDSITYQSQACEQCKSDVQKCRYFKQMVQQGDKTLKAPRSCNAVFLIRSLCSTVCQICCYHSPHPLWMRDDYIYIYICVCVCVCVCMYM